MKPINKVLKNMPVVRNMRTNGNASAENQYIINIGDAVIFQSYSTIIAVEVGGITYLDENAWNYSRTTSRYRSQFLCESTEETRRKIKDGVHFLVDLNKS